MNRSLAYLGLVILCTLSFNTYADQFDVNISNDTVATQYLVDMGQGLFAGGTLLHQKDNGELASLDLIAQDDLRSGQYTFTAGVGGRLIGIFPKGPSNDGGVLALGGFVRYQVPQAKALSLKGEVYYGPSVTSMKKIDGVMIYNAGLDIEVIERAMLHVGYRKIHVKFDTGDTGDLDEGINLGIKLVF